MAPLDSLAAVDRLLTTLIDRGFVRRLDRRPGQKEERYEHLLGGAVESTSLSPAAPPSPPSTNGDLEARVSALEAEVARLRELLNA
jgi:uncharacterized protein YceH (UPF0502 family)